MPPARPRRRHLAAMLLVLVPCDPRPRHGAGASEPVRRDPGRADGSVRVVDRQHADDLVTLDSAGDELVVRVRSARGIGRCTLAADRGLWPAEVTILLEGFGELEDFEVSSGGLRTQGGRGESGRLPRFAGPVDDTRAAVHAAATAVGTLDVRIERTTAGVRVTLPRGLLRDGNAEQATIRWVDWLRR